MEGEETGVVTEAREGGGWEVMGAVPEEERERRFSDAKGTFLKEGDEKLDIDSEHLRFYPEEFLIYMSFISPSISFTKSSASTSS